VESAFDPRALSSKGARGLWQFMPETARRYGLRVDKYMDERLHVVRSTRAAARYMRDLHLLFGDWQLALAAYNAGEQRITAAIERAAGRSFSGLAHVLPEETRLFVPAVLGEMGGRGQ
jgi:membrane-bound lytic murein transglycosylase D